MREGGEVLEVVVAKIAVVVVVEEEEGHELHVVERHQAQLATYCPKLLHCQHFRQLQEVSDAIGLLVEPLQPPQRGLPRHAQLAASNSVAEVPHLPHD